MSVFLKHYDKSKWQKVRLGDVGYFVSGAGFPIRYQGRTKGQIPFLKVSDFSIDDNKTTFTKANNYISTDVREKLRASLIPTNSVIFAKIGAAISLERKRLNNTPVCIDNNMMAFIPTAVNNKFICDIFQTIKLSNFVSATALPSLSAKTLGNIVITIPDDKSLQQKIADTISKLNNHITNIENIIDKQEAIKKSTLKLLLSPKDNWHHVSVSEGLDYEQPGRYIVHNDILENLCKTPVLTANKSFIIGYTEEIDNVYDKGAVIIYDDFTMDMKYVDFAFKVKSSAIKLLTAKTGYDLFFIYSLLKQLELSQQEHARSYISKVARMYIKVPKLEEQKYISDKLQKLDQQLEDLRLELEKYRNIKNGLMDYFFG